MELLDGDVRLLWSPNWIARREDATLVLSAGGDEEHVVSDLGEATLELIDTWLDREDIGSGTGGEAKQLREYLLLLGAAIPDASTTERRPAWTVVGPGHWASELRRRVDQLHPTARGADLLIRDGGSLDDLRSAGHELSNPYLIVDATYHHTISIGPYVVPGLSACAGCLAGRIERRWGESDIAKSPGIQRWTGLAADLIACQLELISANRSALLNATISWDVGSGNSTRDDLLRFPNCEACGMKSSTGRVRLPWLGQATP